MGKDEEGIKSDMAVTEVAPADEITDEMVDAGVRAYYGWDSRFAIEEDLVIRVFEAMMAIRSAKVAPESCGHKRPG